MRFLDDRRQTGAECVDALREGDLGATRRQVKLLDSSVAIDHLRGVPAAVDLLNELIEADEPLLASEIVRFELLAGVRRSEVEALERFISVLSWVPVGEEVTRSAGGSPTGIVALIRASMSPTT